MSQPGGMDMSKLSTGEKLVLGGAIAYFIWVFIPGWYSFEGVTANGMRFPMILAWLLAIVAVAEIALRQFGNMKMNMPWPPGMIHLIVGGAALVLTLLGLLIRPSAFIVTFGIGWALIVGIIIAAIWAYGAYMMYSQPVTTSSMGGGTGVPPAPGGDGGGFTS
jgi:hypothetical protein